MRVVIAEDSVLLREGLERLLDENGLDVVGGCDTAEGLLRKVRSDPPDIAIIDIRLPPTHTDEGLRAALEIRARHPSVGVLVLSQYVELGLAMKLLADSAEGAGTCSRTASATSRSSSAPSDASPRVARRSTRSSSRRSFRSDGPMTRSGRSRRASARCSS
jgi:DNA-binding NarL/FixJ family response regulator